MLQEDANAVGTSFITKWFQAREGAAWQRKIVAACLLRFVSESGGKRERGRKEQE